MAYLSYLRHSGQSHSTSLLTSTLSTVLFTLTGEKSLAQLLPEAESSSEISPHVQRGTRSASQRNSVLRVLFLWDDLLRSPLVLWLWKPFKGSLLDTSSSRGDDVPVDLSVDSDVLELPLDDGGRSLWCRRSLVNTMNNRTAMTSTANTNTPRKVTSALPNVFLWTTATASVSAENKKKRKYKIRISKKMNAHLKIKDGIFICNERRTKNLEFPTDFEPLISKTLSGCSYHLSFRLLVSYLGHLFDSHVTCVDYFRYFYFRKQ